MKKLFIIIAAVLLTATLWAQSPQKMSYQAVIRDGNSILVTSHLVGMRVSILLGATPVYVETHATTTNANGLVTIEIGDGTFVSGVAFSAIDWSAGEYSIKTETDPTGGTNYTAIVGTSQLLSVPYALYAKITESISGTITASQVSDFQTTVTNNASVLLNTAKLTNATHTGDVTGSEVLTLANVNSDVDTFNNITINAKGLATAGSNVSYLTSETDPIWTTASVNYYTKTNMQTSGASQLHFNNLTNTPTTIAGYGITDAVTTTGNQTIAGNKTFSGTTTVITPVNATDATNKAYVDALIEQLYAQGALRVRDYDGNYYNTIKIGNQFWLQENLKTMKYRNGDLIGTTDPYDMDIIGESTPKYQWAYDGIESNVATYGRLYTWYAVTDNRGICPTGWHLPSDAEWTTLTDYLTNNGYGYGGSGIDIAKSMAATSGWTTYGTAGTVGNYQASNNSSSFTALPSGYRNGNGTYDYIGSIGLWWSSTENSTTNAYNRDMRYHTSYVNRSTIYKHDGYSVRCLRD